MHFAILTHDEVQQRVLEGVAERQGIDVSTLSMDAPYESCRSADAVIVDAITVTPELEHCLGTLRARLPDTHLFLLLEGVPEDVSDAQRCSRLGVCLIQRKPFHPQEFFRAAIRTMAQEDAGTRDCCTRLAEGMSDAGASGPQF